MNAPHRISRFVALLALAACAAPEPAPQQSDPAAVGPYELPQVALETGDHVDWGQVSPVAFLDSLVVAGERTAALPADARQRAVPAYTIWEGPGVDWFDSASLAELERRVDSERPAWHVVASKSSFLPFGELSTEGEQARYLLFAARSGRYPVGLGSHTDLR